MDLLEKMETFVRLVEAGSFSAAAKQLRVSVAAVSRHVALLETAVGLSLVARTTRTMTITPAGRTYYESCRRVLGEVERAQAIGRHGIAGPLRMSITVSVAILAEGFVDGLLARHPGLRVDVQVEDQLVNLPLENIDIAIRVGAAPPVSSDVVAVKLASWIRYVVASPSYVAAHGAPKAPLDLSAHVALSTARGASTDRWALAKGKQLEHVRVAPRFTTNAGNLLLHAARKGRGIALLPDFFVADDIERGRLVRLLPEWTSEPTSVHALYRASMRSEARVRNVVDYVKSAFADGSWQSADPPDDESPSRGRRRSRRAPRA